MQQRTTPPQQEKYPQPPGRQHSCAVRIGSSMATTSRSQRRSRKRLEVVLQESWDGGGQENLLSGIAQENRCDIPGCTAAPCNLFPEAWGLHVVRWGGIALVGGAQRRVEERGTRWEGVGETLDRDTPVDDTGQNRSLHQHGAHVGGMLGTPTRRPPIQVFWCARAPTWRRLVPRSLPASRARELGRAEQCETVAPPPPRPTLYAGPRRGNTKSNDCKSSARITHLTGYPGMPSSRRLAAFFARHDFCTTTVSVPRLPDSTKTFFHLPQ